MVGVFVIEWLVAQGALLHKCFERALADARPSLSADRERGQLASADKLFEDGAAAPDGFGRFGYG
jgi:hypothetical protein